MMKATSTKSWEYHKEWGSALYRHD